MAKRTILEEENPALKEEREAEEQEEREGRERADQEKEERRRSGQERAAKATTPSLASGKGTPRSFSQGQVNACGVRMVRWVSGWGWIDFRLYSCIFV